VRRQVYEHRETIGRGQPLPSNIHLERGHPLPLVLIAVGSGIVYEILEGVLN
jgi:hypothetical protein